MGANDGGYATTLRRSGYRGRILSFEPVREPFERLAVKAAGDPLWTVRPWVIGSSEESVDIHVAGNGAASSSVLAMLPRHSNAVPDSRYVRIDTVPQRTLEALWPEFVGQHDRVLLKIDVQGSEKNVLVGAGRRLSQCVGVQIELSFVPLYEGGMLYQEAFSWLAGQGFVPMYILPGFTDTQSGQMYQCDLVCFRE
ncbi:FkbM family methyltransferase [Streptomyces sp. GC420]|nr:FkbM family methyltransferase [Streptomyces sp. GC420]